MTKSLLVTHIANCDYPLWRKWIETYHSWFDEIIICWNISFRFPFFNSFIQSSLSHIPNIKFLDQPTMDYATQDWRNVSTNEMLKYATGDWIISIEQDFFSSDWRFLLDLCEDAMRTHNLFGWVNKTNYPYIHPSFFFVKRELLERTGKDFSPHPEISGSDHFAMVTYKAQELGIQPVSIVTGEVVSDSLCFHLGGVNGNYGLLTDLHRIDIFSVYNHYSQQVKVQSPEFMKLMQEMEVRLPPKQEDMEKWGKFFV